MARRITVDLCRFLLLSAVALVGHAAAAAERPWRIVVLNATDAYLPAFVTIDQATRSVLTAPNAHPVEIYAETLDMVRFPAEGLEPEILALMRKKYSLRPVDAVIAIATPALDFAERHRQDLWPDAKIVFHGVPADALSGRTLHPTTSGILLRFDFARTVELALQLRPATRQVVVIAGSGGLDRRMVREARDQLAPKASHLAIEYWTEGRIEDLVARIGRLPPTAIVLYLSIYRDAAGRVFAPRDALAQLAAASAVPIFGVFDSYMDSGMVAGWANDSVGRGVQAARIVQAALETPPGTPLPAPTSEDSTCVADARMLRRFDVPEALLPPDCRLQFTEQSAWQRYRWQIAVGLAIIAMQALLIAALTLQRRQRRRAELESQAARIELARAARIASLGELTASIAHEIKQPLSAILAHAETAEVLLDAETPSIPEIQRIVAAIRRDNLRANDVITRLRRLLGKHAMDRQSLDLNAVVRDTLQVLESETTRRRVNVECHLDPQLPSLFGDRVHLQQVVLNLMLNAMDALDRVAEGARFIVVRTAAGRDTVELSVSDNGPGIDPSVEARMFDSFVTTKQGGLGLGLSIVRTIVDAHGAQIAAVRGPSGGTVFRLTLPATTMTNQGNGSPVTAETLKERA